MPEKRRAAGGNRRPGDIGGGPKTSQGQYSTPGEARQGPAHGRIHGDVWRKQCRASRHFLKRPPSIAVDLSDLRAALAAGAVWLEVKDTESGVTWATRLDAFQKHGLEVSRGFGTQVALPLASPFWVRRGQSDAAPMLARQPALF